MPTPMWTLAVAAAANAAEAAGMTYEQAVARIPQRELPPFWVGDTDRVGAIVAGLQRAEVKTIAATPGRRPVVLVAFGDREQTVRLANFNSAVGAREPSAYMDKAARKKPVILFVGPVHGHETEGLTGLCNLISVMETGRDLSGREQMALRELGDRCRLLIIPDGNPDGTARFEPKSSQGMTVNDVQFWGQGTYTDDTFCGWPGCKRQHPMVGPNVKFLGCYFNDAGINPMHDEFFAPMGPEAPAILRVAMEEGPDWAVSLHSHEGAPILLRPAYVPLETQESVRSLAEAYYALLRERGLPHGSVPGVGADQGPNPAPFNLTSALYHISGAISFSFECPHGLADDNACRVTHDQILDIQLSLYEVMMKTALTGR